MQAKMDDGIAKTRSGATDCGDSEMGKGKVENIEDNILMAQGHIPVLNRTFNILGTLGLGFR